MKMLSSVALMLTLILNYFDLSSQYDFWPDSASSSGVSRDRLYPPPTGTPHRSRSRSPFVSSIEPPTKISSSDGHVYGLDELRSIRLIPIRNPEREFELRKYTFPVDTKIRVNEIRSSIYSPVPSSEQIVLSTHGGDVFAILTSENTLSGLYKHNPSIKRKGRAKMNMENGTITPLTSDEAKECPVGPNRRMLNDFKIVHVDLSDRPHSSLMSPQAEPPLRIRSRSPVSRCMIPPTRLPSADGRGYELDQLRSIILTSISNPNQGFELRRYSFPGGGGILLHVGPNQYVPISRQEHIVLSTVSGDVFAILESSKSLAGIYAYIPGTGNKSRVKINMRSKTITPLTSDEKKVTPTGRLRPILNYFEVHNSNDMHAHE